VYRHYWRRGIAREAATTMVGYALERHPGHRMIAHIDRGNAASIGVSKALGMRYDGETDFYGTPTDRYALER
jgi:RimJ/RimL family protein N-acetyltransferase